MMKKTTHYLLGIALVGSLASCGGEPVVEKTYDYEKADSLSPEYLKGMASVRVHIEETSKLNNLFALNGEAFNSSALLGASKAGSYSGQKAQALGLGAIGADLNYAVSFEQTAPIMENMKGMVGLSQKLGIQSAFNEELMAKLTDAEDSTVNRSVLLSQLYKHAEDNLYSEERGSIAALMTTGGWLEGLYIATAQIKDNGAEKNVGDLYWEHVSGYGNVVKLLGVFAESNADCKSVLEVIKGLEADVTKVIKDKAGIDKAKAGDFLEKIDAVRKQLL